MEIRPLKSHKLPRYAAALAAITAAGMMTGCGIIDEIFDKIRDETAVSGLVAPMASFYTEPGVITEGDAAVIGEPLAAEKNAMMEKEETTWRSNR